MSHSHVSEAINWWAWDPNRAPMGWFFLDFAVFLLLLIYFTAKPLSRALSERHHNIRRAVTQAAASHAKAIAEQQLWANKLASLDAELRELDAGSRADGEAEAAQMLADAQSRATQLRHDATLQAEQELRRAHERVREQTLAEVLQLAQQMVSSNINSDDQQALVSAASGALPELPHRKKSSKPALGGHP